MKSPTRQLMPRVLAMIVATLALAACGGGSSSSNEGPGSTSVEREVDPVAADPRITTATTVHVAVTPDPSAAAAGRLFVFLPGTQGVPDLYRLVLRSGAARGYHALGLSYPNDEAVGVICLVQPSGCFWDVRREIITGVDNSALVTVGTADAITTRIAKAIAYLDASHPGEGWGQYLVGGAIDWSRVVVGGHSQGGGHAGVMSKLYEMAGACYFSSPPDWSVADQTPATWTLRANLTPASRQYAFGNIGDALVPYDELSQIWSAMGLAAWGGPVSVDSIAPPFGGSHMLTTAVPGNGNMPSPEHGSTVRDAATPMDASGRPAFDPVWAYMCFR
ncbi:MAG: hypothetical protein HYZ20_14550 [Burkholderiales bacterium]|nr:hypothetical protein [Burkholderiales bacterium]